MRDYLTSKIRTLYYIFQLKQHKQLKENVFKKKQEKKLRSLINHAYYNVPFYRKLFTSAGVAPHDIETIDDLKKLPIITKEDVRTNYPDNIISEGTDLSRCATVSTTGSTGMPLKILYSSKMQDYGLALRLFTFSECGLRLTDKLLSIRHSGYPKFNRMFNKLGILNWDNISIFDPIESIVESLKKLRPDVIVTYPSMLLLLSNEIENQNISGINPRIILAIGETLTGSHRSRINQMFNCDIFSLYASEEFSRLAFECKEHTGYHVISDAAIMEIVNEKGDVAEGEEGEIVVTSLFNYVMPFIRYRIGDIGTYTSEICSCGRSLPLIKNIEGRKDDFLILPSGRQISPRTINEIGYIYELKAYKTIQKAKDHIVIEVVKGNGFNENTVIEIKKEIKAACLGEDVRVDVKPVKEIAKERTGKIRTIISNLN